MYAVQFLFTRSIRVNNNIFRYTTKHHQRFIHGTYPDSLFSEPLVKSHFLLPGKFYDLSFYGFRIAGFEIEILGKPWSGLKKPRSTLLQCRYEPAFFKLPHMIICRRASPVNKLCHGYGLVIGYHCKCPKHRGSELFWRY